MIQNSTKIAVTFSNADNDLEEIYHPEVAGPCVRCHGKGFLNPDGTPVNAFEGSDYDPTMECPGCEGMGRASSLGADTNKIVGSSAAATLNGVMYVAHGVLSLKSQMKTRHELVPIGLNLPGMRVITHRTR